MFNYLEPPNAYYEFEKIYTAQQWAKKQRWIVDYLTEHEPDVIGFQEVFSIDSLKELVAEQGYNYFAVVDTPEVIDDFIYKRPVVAIASKYPIVEVAAVEHDSELASTLGLNSEFTFSRKVLRATVTLPHIGNTDCYVVHFKSKRPMINVDEHNKELAPEQNIIEILKANVAGGWGSTIQRGSEATLLMIQMITRREATQQPMLLMGDFNNELADGVLSHLLTSTLRFAPAFDAKTYLAKYCLNDSWDLFVKSQLSNDEVFSDEAITNDVQSDCDSSNSEIVDSADKSQVKNINITKPAPLRPPTHYYGASSSVLDYILLSCEFDASYDDSFFEVSGYNTYDRHLINPEYERDDLTTDHGVVLVTLKLRS
ncbi:endonuclease/exonuclease/phosphatase family protein [Pseudoalteromonas sp. NZS127_1]|uniref:endonuclease/exonuclease/phosphatase family protein n=1 Tax=Pseudoalteromonas sp. NZS127_1 TaxID=2792074 RepID=UPI0018CE587B|nr:endonuclease/exonuclease/phosphatase family protein [Pseudoalteromonas sp. NZS127_1]MBG9993624.1 endonuclease/exonuclease/phosphatase family protein [Pseudoalteromonas sp. NZS127_1]